MTKERTVREGVEVKVHKSPDVSTCNHSGLPSPLPSSLLLPGQRVSSSLLVIESSSTTKKTISLFLL